MIINLNNKDNEEAVDVETLQKETIESMKEYIPNLIPKLEGMCIELRNNIQEDSWEYLHMMIDGFNWVLEAYNGTSSIINKDGVIDESSVQKAVDNLGEAFIDKNIDGTVSAIDTGVLPFLRTIMNNI